MKTNKKLSNLKRAGIAMFASLAFFTTSVNGTTHESVQTAFSKLDALISSQTEMLKYNAPDKTEEDVSAELNKLDKIVDATVAFLKYTAPAEDAAIGIKPALDSLETLLAESDQTLQYNAPDKTDMAEEFNAEVNDMMAETK